MSKYRDDTGMTDIQAKLAFHAGRINGYVNMIDNPMPYDPAGTVIAVIVDIKSDGVVRCALSRQQAKNLASALMGCL